MHASQATRDSPVYLLYLGKCWLSMDVSYLTPTMSALLLTNFQPEIVKMLEEAGTNKSWLSPILN